jgi:hypothetical protein
VMFGYIQSSGGYGITDTLFQMKTTT